MHFVIDTGATMISMGADTANRDLDSTTAASTQSAGVMTANGAVAARKHHVEQA